MNALGSFAQRAAVIVLGLAALSSTALAADKAVATVAIPTGCGTAIFNSNGSAVGAIQIIYTYVGTTFPAGTFGCFDLSMAIADDTGSKDPSYPAKLVLGQIGGENVLLSPNSITLTANGLGAIAGMPQHYDVAINSSVPTNPGLNEDGDTIVGNLRVQSGDNQLRTVTNIQVKILLVHPSVTNCLKTYHEVLDKDTFAVVPSMEVKVQANGPNAGKVNNSNPPGILDSVLVANTCAVDHSFDLLLAPSNEFEVQTAAPGNSIHVYSAAGERKFSYFSSASGAGKGTNLCVGNLVAPSNSTLLTTAALRIRDKNSDPVLSKTGLPNGGDCATWSPSCVFAFSAEFRTAASACSGALLSVPPVSANPMLKSLDFTVN